MGLTPMMQQYMSVKENCKDCILFFRLGDFYEMFFEDAKIAAMELELVLTGKDCGLSERAPMCGIPYHAANMYITRLINKGYKVAIGEQLENPAMAKGIVKRGIVKIITPGTYTDSSFLDDTKNNYIMSLFIDNDTFGISIADVSTGEFNCTRETIDHEVIMNEISKYNPKEILVQKSLDEKLLKEIKERFKCVFSSFDDEFFLDEREENLKAQFSNYEDVERDILIKDSANGLLKYIIDTQKVSLDHINTLKRYSVIDYMSIDMNSRRNLELTETLREKSKKGSLLWVLDKTSTAMGARQLRRWIEEPLVDKTAICDRLDAVEELTLNISLHEDLKASLKQIYDIERLVGKISTQSVNAKEFIFLKNSIEKLPNVKEILEKFKCTLLNKVNMKLDDLRDIYEILDSAVLEAPSISVKEGNIIKDGYNEEVDELRKAKAHGKEWIANLESKEREETNIKSLKISYNKVFGYYIEITKSNLNMVPEGRYIRKQTLANCERYITEELKNMEEKILGAEEKLVSLEYELFTKLRDEISSHIDRMKKSARLLSELDCLSSLASISLENNYCKPKIINNGIIDIKEGRHPVVENMLSYGTFVANDTKLNTKEEQLMLITGPNMAGKSTYMRQVALIVIMAQIGCFVPAKEAQISICDKIFTRIGASDDLAAGKSTFMVEMWEVSNILKNATPNSLIILDEVGRGTSTYDGLSIAWAVVEYICTNKKLKCKTLFATHYHELTSLEGVIDGLKNYSIAVKQIKDDIVFLRKIVKGGADESYGIEVAKLAGLPKEVTKRAKEILENLENENSKEISYEKILEEKPKKVTSAKKQKNDTVQIGFADIGKDNFIKDLCDIDVMNMTPLESMNKLYEIIKNAKNL
ncbi:DNA mismatch repair protein MutS [Clostridium acidisoli DSM 12555]|uniref:DNA mismatch repair protein MutS n=1 Tax=Clostridium acidisoli DSM 12555 TaxID=1121291 RepID=A0A1W1WZM2_9CLOT|nr:DNA mismatch repair protein MutS [Clostridium acidisoli]SMC16980.1 DNA mismatch repair protein MutS [Clostridium acidisoli DSM 12555]